MTARSRAYGMLLLFLLIVAGVSFFGAQFRPGAWYQQLLKPGWTPPNWIFPIVWSVLYLMIAVAGWLIFSGSDVIAKSLWVIQMVLNGIWSWLFFGMHLIGFALVDIVALFVCLSWLLASRISRAAAWLLAPYLIWVAYAAALNSAIYLLNSA